MSISRNFLYFILERSKRTRQHSDRSQGAIKCKDQSADVSRVLGFIKMIPWKPDLKYHKLVSHVQGDLVIQCNIVIISFYYKTCLS